MTLLSAARRPSRSSGGAGDAAGLAKHDPRLAPLLLTAGGWPPGSGGGGRLCPDGTGLLPVIGVVTASHWRPLIAINGHCRSSRHIGGISSFSTPISVQALR